MLRKTFHSDDLLRLLEELMRFQALNCMAECLQVEVRQNSNGQRIAIPFKSGNFDSLVQVLQLLNDGHKMMNIISEFSDLERLQRYYERHSEIERLKSKVERLEEENQIYKNSSKYWKAERDQEMDRRMAATMQNSSNKKVGE